VWASRLMRGKEGSESMRYDEAALFIYANEHPHLRSAVGVGHCD